MDFAALPAEFIGKAEALIGRAVIFGTFVEVTK